mgnify:FL=1|tara:strand:- start:606 stop:1085 length:480 start_codon:yes stop_codon:yes gene_type:complete
MVLGLGIGEVAAGAAMIRASVSFIKENVNTCKDIGELASSIDNLFVGKSKIDKNNTKGVSGTFSIGDIARETVDAKLAEEALYEVSQLINQRFGSQTWATILETRQKRIKDFKERQIKQAKQKAAQRAEMMNDLKLLLWILLGSIVATMAVIAFFFVQW